MPLKGLYALVLSIFLLAGCADKAEDPAPLAVNTQNQYVNKWILENMQYWYLWSDKIPGGVDQGLDPAEYFTRLTVSGDRFSWIQSNYQELLNSLKGINKEAGYEYVLYRESPESETVVAQILYTKAGSPAHNAGLKRGDLITRINGNTLTTSNYRDLIKQLKENHSLTYKTLNVSEKSFSDEATVSLSTIQYQENPNFFHKIIEKGDKRIGYFVYNFFAPGDEDVYDSEMEQIFAGFKNSTITDLVLDLRFNSGGSEVSSKILASLIGAGVSSSNVFFKREYNPQVTQEILKSSSLGEAFLSSKFLDLNGNVGNMLSGKRVYILTSNRTASASELVINALRPYMEVFLIGDVTYGKNVGSISLYEKDDPRNKWGMQPIVTRVSNANGFSDYAEGFAPDVLDKDNSLYIYPLGDEREVLLAAAIARITGVETGRIGVSAKSAGKEVLGTSLDEKPRSFQLILDKEGVPASLMD